MSLNIGSYNSNIIFLLPDATGGVQSFTDNYLKVIKNERIRVIKYKNIESLFDRVELITEGDVETVGLKFSRFSSQRHKLKALHKFIGEGDILICNDSFEIELVNEYRLKNKAVYMLHGDLSHYRNIMDEYNSSIDLVLCVSNGLKDKYEPVYPELKFGVSHPFQINLLETAPVAGAVLNCVFVGKFEFQKGADLFLDLVKSYNGQVRWTIIAITEGSQEELLGQIPAQVKIHTDLSNEKIIKILDEADVLIFPSRTEGFGIAIQEAMSRGVVPIVLDIPIGIPDQVVHGINGFKIKVEEWHDAGSYLNKLTSDSNILIQMKSNAIRYVRENFNSVAITDKFLFEVKNAPIKNNKKFSKQSFGKFECLPEPVFRILKYINSKLKYG